MSEGMNYQEGGGTVEECWESACMETFGEKVWL